MRSASTAITREFASAHLEGAARRGVARHDPEHPSLDIFAARALADGDWDTAFRLADRRCRIAPPAEAHAYVLRAEAAFRLGERPAALADIEKALELAPADIAANRRLLAWGESAKRLGAARALVRVDASPGVLRSAIKLLLEEGEAITARVTALDDRIEGWAVWRDPAPLEVTLVNEADRVAHLMEPDPSHPFADLGHAARFTLRRPRSEWAHAVTLTVAERNMFCLCVPANEPPARARPPMPAPPAKTPQSSVVTIIVPVYADFDATRACLESLLAACVDSPHRVLIVDDATPDAGIARWLSVLRGRPGVEILVNAVNLGFVGSVNRALAHTCHGDVLLLNADTIAPPCLADRLAAVAHSATDIGTVTPLSNHGEFTSFPKPNAFNPLESRRAMQKLDRTTAACNAGVVVDIPSGVGFCLYVTRACLDAVGTLCEDFHRGYLEDVEFCLRARDRGFRNVCAASVYVGHAGSRSFGEQKRALVMRNVKVLESRFPAHRSECGAFMLADPLRAARQSIERAMPSALRPTLLVAGAGVIGAVARARAAQLAAGRRAALIVEAGGSGGRRIRFFNPAGGAPQSLQFDLDSPNECDAMLAYGRALRPAQIEFVDTAGVPLALADLLLGLDAPHDVLIADAGLRAAIRDPDATTESSSWRAIAGRAARILAPCAQAQAFAAAILPGRQAIRIDLPRRRRRAARRARANCSPRLAIVPVRLCAKEQRQIACLAQALKSRRPDVSINVLGATLDDVGLMRGGDVFVTGRIEAAELEHMIGAYRLDALFLNLTAPLFGHPVVRAAHAASAPLAYRDWSTGAVPPNLGDLSIAPDANVDAIAEELAAWLPRP